MKHGTYRAYEKGCRCDACKAVKAKLPPITPKNAKAEWRKRWCGIGLESLVAFDRQWEENCE